ncbi:hypothetical protein GCM10010195_73300 [Kitasatospora griseola]|nr:hypothetical protein GCM10010195_73300 [Kitasatospora griseola]
MPVDGNDQPDSRLVGPVWAGGRWCVVAAVLRADPLVGLGSDPEALDGFNGPKTRKVLGGLIGRTSFRSNTQPVGETISGNSKTAEQYEEMRGLLMPGTSAASWATFGDLCASRGGGLPDRARRRSPGKTMPGERLCLSAMAAEGHAILSWIVSVSSPSGQLLSVASSNPAMLAQDRLVPWSVHRAEQKAGPRSLSTRRNWERVIGERIV